MASFIPVCAFMLATRTHAPDMVWLAGALGLEAAARSGAGVHTGSAVCGATR